MMIDQVIVAALYVVIRSQALRARDDAIIIPGSSLLLDVQTVTVWIRYTSSALVGDLHAILRHVPE